MHILSYNKYNIHCSLYWLYITKVGNNSLPGSRSYPPGRMERITELSANSGKEDGEEWSNWNHSSGSQHIWCQQQIQWKNIAKSWNVVTGLIKISPTLGQPEQSWKQCFIYFNFQMSLNPQDLCYFMIFHFFSYKFIF